ncbi:phosphate transport system substrate-binding protein [Flexibacter flexilis DSM 6793]|uniref:Phosphate transport system substrate-binding protein n=1 Tax=Flexibacter flexilis DSM 6793 TaxID=927664 RepID=A0A1I1K3U7_9BACT|nr:substrate-binding domain-containing protein [Flexibacter flexilis]SFC52683.1 phosphate transport system substrate-binding protein [Flexibacter flexilis DSM 6793]
MAVLAAAVAVSSCDGGSGASEKKLDTPTSGQITIAADESFMPIVKAEIDVFEATYPEAHFKSVYESEGEAFKHLLADSARVIIVSRQLNDNEKAQFKQQTITPTTTKLAVDAVALIVNNANPDSLLTVQQIGEIMHGRYTSWKHVNAKSKDEKVVVVFDKSNSSNLSFMRKYYKLPEDLQTNIFAANSNEEVVKYVSKTPNAIGVIGVNWISDSEDPKHMSFRREVKTVAVADSTPPASQYDYYQPFQAYISNGSYPYCRNIYSISREARMGLGNGFVAFAASDPGQRIVLKAGILPATAPIRVVNFNKNKSE